MLILPRQTLTIYDDAASNLNPQYGEGSWRAIASLEIFFTRPPNPPPIWPLAKVHSTCWKQEYSACVWPRGFETRPQLFWPAFSGSLVSPNFLPANLPCDDVTHTSSPLLFARRASGWRLNNDRHRSAPAAGSERKQLIATVTGYKTANNAWRAERFLLAVSVLPQFYFNYADSLTSSRLHGLPSKCTHTHTHTHTHTVCGNVLSIGFLAVWEY